VAKKKFVPVVAVLNMKGGVGKTTLSANVFRRLYFEKKISTLLLDLDPQFNLTQALFKRSEYDKLRSTGETLAKVFNQPTKAGLLEISKAHEKVPDPKSLAKSFWHVTGSSPLVHLDVVPGDFALVKYSLIDDQSKLAHAKSRFSEFVDKAKEEYGLVVLDCNPSSSFLTVCALSVCTHVLVPVRMDKYSVLGLEMLWEYVHDILPISPKPEFVVLLNAVKRSKSTKAMKETEAELRGHAIFGAKTLGNAVRDTGQLTAKTDYTGFSVDRKTSVTGTVKMEINSVANELATKLGIK
jgi:chromosome partitioning protein